MNKKEYTIETISDNKIRDIIRKEFGHERFVYNMQVFYGMETVIRIIKHFLNDTNV